MKRLRSQEGFTLIELVIIILVLGILAATAIPKFYDLSTKAKEAAEKGVVGGVRGGISIAYASNLLNNTGTFPAALDTTSVGGTTCAVNPCFGDVLSPAVVDPLWSCTTAGSVYVGPAGTTYTYTALDGTFQ